MIESAFYSALIALLPGQRLYPLVLPNEPTLPAAVYSVVGASSAPTLDTSGLTKYRVEVSSFGKSYKDAYTLRSQLKTALDGYQDANMSVTWIRSTDLFEHELLSYRCLAEFEVFSIL